MKTKIPLEIPIGSRKTRLNRHPPDTPPGSPPGDKNAQNPPKTPKIARKSKKSVNIDLFHPIHHFFGHAVALRKRYSKNFNSSEKIDRKKIIFKKKIFMKKKNFAHQKKIFNASKNHPQRSKNRNARSKNRNARAKNRNAPRKNRHHREKIGITTSKIAPNVLKFV